MMNKRPLGSVVNATAAAVLLTISSCLSLAVRADNNNVSSLSELGSSPSSELNVMWSKPLIPVTADFTLANGLRVIVSEDHSAPVAALAIVYDVGARNEVRGHSGFAHLFEHMMFQGSENVGKTEHFKYIEAAGGTLNASTHEDFTNYFEKLPSNQIELALWLESDRMRSLKVTPENLENQLQTVKEEKRLRIDDQPYIPADIKMEETVFDNWANAHPVIGDFTDLDASSIDDVRAFFHKYYAPNNATMAIVGDVDSNNMHKLVEKYFGTIARQPELPTPDVREPVQTKQKYLKVEDNHAQLPAFWVSWKAPARRDPDSFTLGIIEKLLSAGDSSRLYQSMVKGEKVALKAEASYGERRGPSIFETMVIYKPGVTAEGARKILWAQLAKLQAQPVSDQELQKAKNQMLRGLFSSNSYESLQRSLARAELLAEYTSFYKDPSLIDSDLMAYLKVTPQDVQRVAAQILTQSGATIVDVVPTAGKDTGANKDSDASKKTN